MHLRRQRAIRPATPLPNTTLFRTAELGSLIHPEEMLAGTITLVYRSERGRVRHQLSLTQANYLKEVISSQHVFLEHDQSLEVLLVQGPAVRLQELCDAIRRIRGMQQLELVTTTSLLPPLHKQDGSNSNTIGTIDRKRTR